MQGCKTCLQSLVSRSGSGGERCQGGGRGRERGWRAGCRCLSGGQSSPWRAHCTRTWTASGRLLNSNDCTGSGGGVAGLKGRSERRGRIGVMRRGSRGAGTGWQDGTSGSWTPRPTSGTTTRGRRH